MEIDRLSSEIHSLIKSFTSLEISEADAGASLDALNKEYDNLLEITPVGPADRITEGICYRHNISNFALFTGLYSIENGAVQQRNICGEDFLSAMIKSIIEKNTERLHKDKVLTIPPHGDLKNNLHLFTAESSLVIATLSSSPYFDEVLFTQTALEIASSISHIIPPEDCGEIYGELKSYIRNNSPLNAIIFNFRNMKKIFSHMGIRSIIEISDHLCADMAAVYPNSKIFRLSLVEIVVLGKGIPNVQPKLNYNGIFITFAKREISLDGIESFYKLTELIFSLNDGN